MDSLDRFAAEKLAHIRAAGLYRALAPTARGPGAAATRDGRPLISFSCNDYLNLSLHPEVKARAQAAIDAHGAGSGASRLVTGNHPLLVELEARLARLKGAEDAVVFGSGYLANIGIIPSLVGRGDLILIDELAHNCLYMGAKLSGAETLVFRHNDMDDLEALLHAQRPSHGRAMILTDGVFSMDGDLAPLAAICPLARAHDAWALTDDAHGIGVVGDGRGSSFVSGAKADVPLQMGTLSKAIGSYGGYLCASHAVIDYIRNRARSFIFSTGLPPASAAAAIAALDLIERDPALRAAPLVKARLFTDRLGLPAPQSPIVPIIVGGAAETLAASAALMEKGFLVTGIRPPSVPEGTARLRVTFSAAHADSDVLALADAIAALGLAGQGSLAESA
ncbi:MAG: 8-amino-7-oxononanoate synthase [Proteobacteria bacterium]|nr:MAG: 8-amino-7-oxononanoate synthase [Pseudomonadota bacterium]